MTGTAEAARSSTKPSQESARDATGPLVSVLRARLWPVPVHPLFVAVYPILLAYSDNLAEVQLSQTFGPVLRAVAVAATLTVVTGVPLRDIRRGALVASILTAVWFSWHFLLMAAIAPGLPLAAGASLVVWLALMAILAVVRLPERLVGRATSVTNLVTFLMVAIVGASIAPHEMRAASGPVPVDRGVAPAGTRDVWFLVFDRYGNEDAMRESADVDNDLPEWLEQRGFMVADRARANYGRTAMSLAATLTMTYLDELIQQQGPASNNEVPLTDMLQDAVVGRLFQEHGYRYVHIGSSFGPTRTSAIADDNPVLPDHSDFTDNMLRGISALPLVQPLLWPNDPPPQDMLHRAAARFDWQELDRVSDEAGPKFVFGHVLLPHEPYVFDADGSYAALSDGDAKYSSAAEAAQMAYTNGQIRRLVTKLLDVPDEQRPIIIVTSDEGPYPVDYAFDPEAYDWATASDTELMTKYGVLLAMYLPGEVPEDEPEPYEDMSLINTFPIVFDRYLDEDIPLLQDRSYTSRSWSRPYDLTDVTDRLQAIMS